MSRLVHKIVIGKAFAAAIVFSSLPTLAQTPAERAFAAMLQRPDDIAAVRRYAELQIEAENYEAAIATLERLLIPQPNQSQIRTELGILYFRLGSYDAAASYLRKALESTDLTPELRAQAERFLADSVRRGVTSKFAGSINLGGRFQSNPTAASTEQIVRSSGLRVARPQGPRNDFSGVASLDLRHEYDLGTQDNATLVSTLAGYGTRYVRNGQVDVGLVEGTVGVRFRPSPADAKEWLLRPYLVANHVILAGTQLFSTGGAGVETSYALSEATTIGGRYEYRYSDYARRSDVTGATLQSRSENSIQGQIATEVAPLQVVVGSIRYRVADTKFSGYDFDSVELRAAYTVSFQEPVKLSGFNWSLTPSVGVEIRNFRAPDPTYDPRTIRNDNDVRFGAMLAVPFDQDWIGLLQVEQVFTRSNIPNFTSQNTSVQLGLLFQF